MKAVVCIGYGVPDKALKLSEIDKPVPEENEVLVEVHASSVNAADWRMSRPSPAMLRLMPGAFSRPKIRVLGGDVAGRVEAVGKNVKSFKPGDAVFGRIFYSGGKGYGAFAEYACVPEATLALKPAGISYQTAAALPLAGQTALQALRDVTKIMPGQKVLIDGASGGVGHYAVQIAKAFGAEVTAVCRTRNLGLVRSWGADHVIDYVRENFTESGRHYDFIMAANGSHSYFEYKKALSPRGTFVMTGGKLSRLFQIMFLGRLLSRKDGQKFRVTEEKRDKAGLEYLAQLAVAGKIKPYIDRRYPLAEVAKGIAYMQKEHTRGKVVITVAGE